MGRRTVKIISSPSYKTTTSSHDDALEDKFARMCLTQNKGHVLRVLLNGRKKAVSAAVNKPLKKKRTPTIAVKNKNHFLPWTLYHMMKRVATLQKILDKNEGDVFDELELKGIEDTIADTVAYHHKYVKDLPTDWKYDRAAAMSLERIERWDELPPAYQRDLTVT